MSSRGDEPVAEPSFRPDVGRIVRVVAEFVPEAADVDPDVVDLVDVLASPDLREQRPVLEDVAGVPDEVVEQLVFGRGQVEPVNRPRTVRRRRAPRAGGVRRSIA